MARTIHYPPIGSRWKANDPRDPREIQIVEHDPDNDRIAVRSVAKGRLSYINPISFNRHGRTAYTRIHDDESRSDAANELLEAVGKFVAAHGGSVLVAGGIQIHADDAPLNFRLSVKCTGEAPPSRRNGP